MKHKLFLSLILIGFVFIGCSKDDITNTTNELVFSDCLDDTEWVYHKDTPDYFSIPDFTFDWSLFKLEFISYLIHKNLVEYTSCEDNMCNSFMFTYEYKKPNIIFTYGTIILQGSINGNLMTLYDKNNNKKKYIFVQVKDS